MDPTIPIPEIVVSRLPIYLRTLQRMCETGQHFTSSRELGRCLGISAAQIRKDLSLFGEFGKQGTGYQISFLIEQIRSILHIDRVWDVVVVGAGDIGHAVAHYQGFAERGFRVTMVFDNDPQKIGTMVGKFPVQDIAGLVAIVSAAQLKVAMLAVPPHNAQEVTDLLVKAGIRAILNYAPINLVVPEGVYVQDTDPLTHLQRMAYHLA